MSKINRMMNSEEDTLNIYEIYRACRLCGAGAGYKMPIIQNVVDLEDTDVELKQKIRECVQIEVDQDDKMPPLICELCVDKVNDFYEFLEMCRQINKRTRLQLGLPIPTGAADAGDCILGLTEPVFVNEDSDAEPLVKHQKKEKNKRKNERRVRDEREMRVQEKELKVQIEPIKDIAAVLGRARPTRTAERSEVKIQDKSKEKQKDTKSVLKKIASSPPIYKRPLRSEASRDDVDTPSKRVKMDVKPFQVSPPSKDNAKTPKTSKDNSKPKPKQSPVKKEETIKIKIKDTVKIKDNKVYKCELCLRTVGNQSALNSHMRTHSVGFTSPSLACNACGDWYPTTEEAVSHHREHEDRCLPYTCRRCTVDYTTQRAYDEHFSLGECIPDWDEVPDVSCLSCSGQFATYHLLDTHVCPGEAGNCKKCEKAFTNQTELRDHEYTCRKKGEPIIEPHVIAMLRPLQIRITRCNSLLKNKKNEHYDVSTVPYDFGLDGTCIYPYRFDTMVSISDEIKDEFLSKDDWDSDDEKTTTAYKTTSKVIDKLSIITLKTIYNLYSLEKLNKKQRRVEFLKIVFKNDLVCDENVRSKIEMCVDDVLNAMGGGFDIANIIDSLGDDDDSKVMNGGDEENDHCLSKNVSLDTEIRNDGVIFSDKDSKSNDIDLKSSGIDTKTNDIDLKASGIDAKNDIDLKSSGIDTKTNDIDSKSIGIDIKTNDIDLKSSGIDTKTNDINSKSQEMDEDRQLMADLDAQIGENIGATQNEKLDVDINIKNNENVKKIDFDEFQF